VVDAGTGILPLSRDFATAKGSEVLILYTHWHHDHTLGFPLSHFPYMPGLPVHLYGPYEHNVGPKEVYEMLMRQPLFPVNLHDRHVGCHLQFHNIARPNSTVIAIHPTGGLKQFEADAFERLVNDGKQLPFHNTQKFDLGECLVVKLHQSNHPERTISYRFEEQPTGKTFVFVTDNENVDGIPASFKEHVRGANLLVIDCQYTRAKYESMTAGWGHGTPDNAARIAIVGEAQQLGLTHHDPWSSDELIDEIVSDARNALTALGNTKTHTVFGCRDYTDIEL
jgi:ribonuclease BN (tRNA processing enzyme)